MNENHNHNRTNRNKQHMRENLTEYASWGLMRENLAAQKFSCAKISTFTVYHKVPRQLSLGPSCWYDEGSFIRPFTVYNMGEKNS